MEIYLGDVEDQIMVKKILLLTRNIEKIRSVSNFLENKGFSVEIATSVEQVEQLAIRPYSFAIQVKDFTDFFTTTSNLEKLKQTLAHIPTYKINDPLLNSKLTEDLLKIAISNIGKKPHYLIDAAEGPHNNQEVLLDDTSELVELEIDDKTLMIPNAPHFQDINHHVENLDHTSKNILFSISEIMLEKNLDDKISSNDYLNLATVKIYDPSSEGCFLIAIPEGLDRDIFIKQVEKIQKLISAHIGSNINIEIVEEKIKKEVYDSIKKSSKKVMEGDFEGQDLLISFFKMPSEKVKSFETVIKNEMCLIEVEDWWSKIPLPVNAYIFLELNNRKILYIRHGQAAPSDLSERLNAKSQNHLWIEEKELHKYKQIRYIMSLPLAV